MITTVNLFVGNLNPETNAEGLRKLFSEFGEIVAAKVIFDSATGASRGFGFVEMTDKYHSFDAIDNLDCSFFEGNIISVKEAKQSGNAKPGGGKQFNKPFNKPFNRPFNKPRPRPRADGESGGGSGFNDQDFNKL
jgi:RNA recognition motif-containing protein